LWFINRLFAGLQGVDEATTAAEGSLPNHTWKKASSFPKGLQAFFLNHLFGLTYKDVAEIVGISPASVKTHIRHLTKDVKTGVMIVKFDEDMNITQLNHREKEKRAEKGNQLMISLYETTKSL